MIPARVLTATYLGDHLADGADAVEALLDDNGHLDGQLPVLLKLLALLFLLGSLLHWFLLGNVLEEGAMANRVSFVVHHVAIVVDAFAAADAEVTGSEFSNDISVLVEHVLPSINRVSDLSLIQGMSSAAGEKNALFGARLLPVDRSKGGGQQQHGFDLRLRG